MIWHALRHLLEKEFSQSLQRQLLLNRDGSCRIRTQQTALLRVLYIRVRRPGCSLPAQTGSSACSIPFHSQFQISHYFGHISLSRCKHSLAVPDSLGQIRFLGKGSRGNQTKYPLQPSLWFQMTSPFMQAPSQILDTGWAVMLNLIRPGWGEKS